MKKVCKKCGVEKPLTDFHLSKGGYLGRRARCKACVSTKKPRTDNIDPKVCNKCGISKPLIEYNYEKNRDRYRGECKSCKNTTRRIRYPKVKDKLNAKYRDRWANEPDYRERQLQISAKSREKHGWKYRERRQKLYSENPEFYREKGRQWTANMTEDQRKNKKETNKIYREINKEELKIKQKKYVENNKEKIKARQKKYYDDNPEHMRKLRKLQYDKHKDKLVQDQREYRTNRRLHLIERLGGKCVECGSTRLLQFDHIDPFKKSFTVASKMTAPIEVLYEEVDKCQLLCAKCHFNKTKNEWLDGTLYEKRYGEEGA